MIEPQLRRWKALARILPRRTSLGGTRTPERQGIGLKRTWGLKLKEERVAPAQVGLALLFVEIVAWEKIIAPRIADTSSGEHGRKI